MTDDEPSPYRNAPGALPRLGTRTAQPVGRTAAFVAAAREALGQAFVTAWLSRITCQFEDCVIWTSDYGQSVLRRRCSGLIAAHNIAVKVDDQSRAHFTASTGMVGTLSGKGRRR